MSPTVPHPLRRWSRLLLAAGTIALAAAPAVADEAAAPAAVVPAGPQVSAEPATAPRKPVRRAPMVKTGAADTEAVKPGAKPAKRSSAKVATPAPPSVPQTVATVPPKVETTGSTAAKPEAPARADAPPASGAAPASAKVEPAPPHPPTARSPAQDYCAGVADAATQSVAAFQARKLAEIEVRVREKIKELDAKRAEYQQWVAQQEEARKRAEEGVVAIYSKMRPDAAAQQLALLDETGAAAVLSRMTPRAAGTILNEMTAGKAARLTDTMTRIAIATRAP